MILLKIIFNFQSANVLLSVKLADSTLNVNYLFTFLKI